MTDLSAITETLQSVLREQFPQAQADVIAQKQADRLASYLKGDRLYFSRRLFIAERDSAIRQALKTDSVAVVAARFGLSKRRVYQILRKVQFFG